MTEPRAHHRHAVQSAQTFHALQEADNNSSTFNGFDCPGEQIRRDSFEILEDEHVERLTQNLVRVLVVAAGGRM